MFRRLFALLLACFCYSSAQAQFPYLFRDTIVSYTPLSGVTSVNNTTIWDNEDYLIPMPFNWRMDSATSVSGFPLTLARPGVISSLNPSAQYTGFIFGDMNIADRGKKNMVSSQSPIRYDVIGSAPNRIFRVEIANGGFLDELVNYSTMNDSFNLQIWIYEDSSALEYHFGPSKVSNPSDYFGMGGSGPFMAYARRVSTNASSGKVFYLTGNASAPGIDSLALPLTSLPTNQLSSWPASDVVYRFTPSATCPVPAAPTFSISYGAGYSVQLTYTGDTTSLDSLVWNFGDGQRQNVSTNKGAPLSYSYTSAGHYGVTVTAYNICGSTTSSTQQTSVSVADINAARTLHAYPNPASGMLTIEGAADGDLSILSFVGQPVLQQRVRAGKVQIDMSGFAAGNYMIVLRNENGHTEVLKIAKQ